MPDSENMDSILTDKKRKAMTRPSKNDRESSLANLASGKADVFDVISSLDKASSISSGQRKSSGVVYTPKKTAADMCSLANPSIDDAVFEPSCGRGVFVFSLAEHHLKHLPVEEVHQKLSQNLVACDIDPDAIFDLKAIWISYWKSKGVDQPIGINAICDDSLFGEHSSSQFDLVIGNPPYVRFQHLPKPYRTKLQNAFSSCRKGNVDIFFAFVEKSISQAKKSCLIFPNSWMTSVSGLFLRNMLSPRISKIADFGDSLVFPPVRAYVCIALVSQTPRRDDEPMKIQTDGLSVDGPWIEMASNDNRICPKRWSISSVSGKKQANQKTLGDIATIQSGIATLADGQYAIKNGIAKDGSLEFYDPVIDKKLTVDIRFTPKKIKLTKAKSESDIVSWSERIAFPYDDDSRIVPFSKISEEHSDLASFLIARKERLATRDKGVQNDYPEWHAYGRKQGLRKLPAGELCAIPVMSQGSIQCFPFDTAKTGQFLFTSGFVLAPKPGHSCAEIIDALRSESSWQWILAHGKPWAGSEGKTYRSYGARLLMSMPLPIPKPKPKT